MKYLQSTKFLKFDSFISKACLGCFEWIYGANSFVPINKWPVFEGNIIVGLFSDTGSHIFLVNPYY